MNYLPLNVKTCYSFFESAFDIEHYVLKGKELGLKYLAICDDNPYAFCEFATQCKINDIKPILGMHFDFVIDKKHYVFNLFIKNEDGYKIFCKIYNDETNFLKLQNEENLICVISTLDIINRQTNIDYYKNLFRSFYLGEECYSEEEKNRLVSINNFSLKNNFKTIPFYKVKALNKMDGLTLDILDAIKNEKTIDIIKESKTPYFLLTPNSVKKIYGEESIKNLEEFFNIDFDIFKKRGTLPIYQFENKKEYLLNKAICFLKDKNIYNNTYLNRLNYELDIIDKMGFLDYFIVVSYYVNKAKEENIKVGPGRGSASSSLLAYCLKITEIDPMKYDLLFERFLNPERITLPDIDVDFADYKRNNVLKIIEDKYSKDNVKQIITFQTFKAKQAVKDIGKIFKFNASDINLLSKTIGNNQTFKDAEKDEKFNLLMKESIYKTFVNLAKRIEGFPRQKGIHAAGVIINNEPLYKTLPLKKEDQIVPFEANYLEKLGYIKMDVLALKNISLIEEMEKNILEINPTFSLKDINLNDQKTFDVLNNGLTKSIFQLEGEGITKALKLIRINSFLDIVCLNALYRPGPIDNIELYARRKNEHEAFTYINKDLEPFLKETYGIIVYQEQIMQIVKKIASFTLAKADLLRRAISKKDENKLISLKDEFINGALKNNYSYEMANTLFDYILKFSNYGFNKAHSVSYSLITYQMAYIKANYPTIFYSVIFSNQKGIKDKYEIYSSELNYFNIKLLNPSINKSYENFVYEGNNLRLPLNEILEINTNIEKNILDERKNGVYKTILDFIKRTSKFKLDIKYYQNLINAGCFDELYDNRTSLLMSLDNLIAFINNFPNLENFTNEELDAIMPKYISIEENISNKNKNELDCLNILLSGDLFYAYLDLIKKENLLKIKEVLLTRNENVKFICLVSSYREIKTKNGEKMALIEVYDQLNNLKCIVFPKKFDSIPPLNKHDFIVVEGYYKEDKIGKSFIANKITKLEEK